MPKRRKVSVVPGSNQRAAMLANNKAKVKPIRKMSFVLCVKGGGKNDSSLYIPVAPLRSLGDAIFFTVFYLPSSASEVRRLKKKWKTSGKTKLEKFWELPAVQRGYLVLVLVQGWLTVYECLYITGRYTDV